MNATLVDAYRFFREHAGYVVGESARCALALARAEASARDAGLRFEWEDEEESYQDVYGEPLPDDVDGPFFVACYFPGEKHPRASLGCVTLAVARPWSRDPYTRVVEAELASEALDNIADECAPLLAARATYAGPVQDGCA